MDKRQLGGTHAQGDFYNVNTILTKVIIISILTIITLNIGTIAL